MNQGEGNGDSIILNLPLAMGADAGVSIDSFSIYVPNKTKDGVEIGNQRKWVLEALSLLSKVGSGATAMPPAEGVWLDNNQKAVWDHPVIAYSYVEPDRLRDQLPHLREFLHRMGRETDQGEVAFEFNDRFYRIHTYDPPGGAANGQENR